MRYTAQYFARFDGNKSIAGGEAHHHELLGSSTAKMSICRFSAQPIRVIESRLQF
jgi:hypothetical protein